MIHSSSMEGEEIMSIDDNKFEAQPSIKLHRLDKKWRIKARNFQSYKFCNKCDYIFASFRDVTSHKSECIVGDKKLLIYECDMCGGKFNKKLKLLLHFNNAIVCKCDVCEATFGCKILLSKHYEEKHDFSCDQCTFVGESKELLKDHKINHSQEYVCRRCGSRFKRLTSVEQHQKICKVAPNICLICSKTFENLGDLLRHRIVAIYCQGFQCDYCSRRFDRKDKITRHISIHAKFPCEVCGEKLTNSTIRTHMRVKHYKHFVRKFKYKCAECRRSFKTKETLTSHSHRHKKNRFVCPFGCHESFTNIDELKKHKTYHIGKSLWKCTHCAYTTKFKDCIRRHMKTLKMSLRAHQICPLYLINLRLDQKRKAKAQKSKEKQVLQNKL